MYINLVNLMLLLTIRCLQKHSSSFELRQKCNKNLFAQPGWQCGVERKNSKTTTIPTYTS